MMTQVKYWSFNVLQWLKQIQFTIVWTNMVSGMDWIVIDDNNMLTFNLYTFVVTSK